MNDRKQLFADWLFDGETWQQNSSLTIVAGKILSVEHETSCPLDAERHQIILPGMPNLHSHSFQRAFAGDTEKRTAGQDSFWSWRQQSYAFLQRV